MLCGDGWGRRERADSARATSTRARSLAQLEKEPPNPIASWWWLTDTQYYSLPPPRQRKKEEEEIITSPRLGSQLEAVNVGNLILSSSLVVAWFISTYQNCEREEHWVIYFNFLLLLLLLLKRPSSVPSSSSFVGSSSRHRTCIFSCCCCSRVDAGRRQGRALLSI